ncbi:uncharacterized protein LOC124269005 [Haliotis rubra]|uniref:uncharacterized protein LOC124269005 n=1 Tax=Haliotis rubra TaxID=36100 RepID=UPI001EE612E0|nr:uncharacterized protein LOC124269005 [Haliotis rubra]
MLNITVVLGVLTLLSVAKTDDWKPTSWEHCRTNADCNNTALCCSITPALGRRRQLFPLEVNYCLPYKAIDAPWCSLRLQYSDAALNYHGLCPCGPGLKCSPSDDLDPKYYPRDRYGKCVSV